MYKSELHAVEGALAESLTYEVMESIINSTTPPVDRMTLKAYNVSKAAELVCPAHASITLRLNRRTIFTK